MTHAYSGNVAATGTRVWSGYPDTPRTPREARERLAAFLGDREYRRLGKVREVRREPGGTIVVRLYSTDVVTYYPNGSIEIDWGGWHTLTTNTTIHDHLPLFYGVSGHARVTVQTPRHEDGRPFADRWYWLVPRFSLVRISPRGTVSYKRRGETTGRRAERFDDWRAADRVAKKLEGSDA